jgi:hypothetical protein
MKVFKKAGILPLALVLLSVFTFAFTGAPVKNNAFADGRAEWRFDAAFGNEPEGAVNVRWSYGGMVTAEYDENERPSKGVPDAGSYIYDHKFGVLTSFLTVDFNPIDFVAESGKAPGDVWQDYALSVWMLIPDVTKAVGMTWYMRDGRGMINAVDLYVGGTSTAALQNGWNKLYIRFGREFDTTNGTVSAPGVFDYSTVNRMWLRGNNNSSSQKYLVHDLRVIRITEGEFSLPDERAQHNNYYIKAVDYDQPEKYLDILVERARIDTDIPLTSLLYVAFKGYADAQINLTVRLKYESEDAYAWVFDGTLAGAGSENIRFEKAGGYSVEITAFAGSETLTATAQISCFAGADAGKSVDLLDFDSNISYVLSSGQAARVIDYAPPGSPAGSSDKSVLYTFPGAARDAGYSQNFGISYGLSIDASGIDPGWAALDIWLYTSAPLTDLDKVGNCDLMLGSNDDWVNNDNYAYGFYSFGLQPGWNHIQLKLTRYFTRGGEPALLSKLKRLTINQSFGDERIMLLNSVRIVESENFAYGNPPLTNAEYVYRFPDQPLVPEPLVLADIRISEILYAGYPVTVLNPRAYTGDKEVAYDAGSRKISVKGPGAFRANSFTFTPPVEGVYEITVTATDYYGKTLTKTAALTIGPLNLAPNITLTTPLPQGAKKGEYIPLANFRAADPEGKSVTLVVSALDPAGNKIVHDGDGFTVRAPGHYKITVAATDEDGVSAEKLYIIEVGDRTPGVIGGGTLAVLITGISAAVFSIATYAVLRGIKTKKGDM